jgi:hypothetical protein
LGASTHRRNLHCSTLLLLLLLLKHHQQQQQQQQQQPEHKCCCCCRCCLTLLLLLPLLLLPLLLLPLLRRPPPGCRSCTLHAHHDAAERLCRMLLRLAPRYRRCRGSGYANRTISALPIYCRLQSHRRSQTCLLGASTRRHLHYSSLLLLLLLLLLQRLLLLLQLLLQPLLAPPIDAAERLCRMLRRLAPWY